MAKTITPSTPAGSRPGAGVAVWAYCLMPNHVHLILVPATANGLRSALGEAHRRYTRAINQRQGWVGHLWQGRFASCALDAAHLVAAARYVELNPVRAHLVERPETWPWSSAKAHLAGQDDGLVTVAPLLEAVGDWSAFLDTPCASASSRRCAGTSGPGGRWVMPVSWRSSSNATAAASVPASAGAGPRARAERMVN